jgi:hypothetical protein
METVEKIAALIGKAQEAGLNGLDLVESFPIEEIQAAYNGIGPEWAGASARDWVTAHLDLFAPAALIHDLRYTRSDGSVNEQEFADQTRDFVHVDFPNPRHRKAAGQFAVKGGHMAGNQLLTQSTQSHNLFVLVRYFRCGPTHHGAFEVGGKVIVCGNILPHKADPHPIVLAEQIQLLALQRTMEIQVLPYSHKGQRQTIGFLPQNGYGTVLTFVDYPQAEVPISLPVFSTHTIISFRISAGAILAPALVPYLSSSSLFSSDIKVLMSLNWR